MTDLMNMPSTLDALVEHLREADTGSETNLWDTADLILAAVADELPKTAAGRGAYKSEDSSLLNLSFRSEAAREAGRKIAGKLEEEGILIAGREPNEETLLSRAETAHIWPKEERVKEAAFWAHRALNPPKYDGTRQRRLLELRDKSRNGRVTEPAVRSWIRGRTPAERQTFLEKVDRRLRQAVKASASPWGRLGDEDKLAVAKVLREIAGEIERGEFS